MARPRTSTQPPQTKSIELSLLPPIRSAALPSEPGRGLRSGEASDGARSVGATRSVPRRGSDRLTVKLLEQLRPGDRVQDTEIGGLYAECGAKGVTFKLAVDVTRGKTVRRTLAQWRPGSAALDLRELRADAARLRADVRAGSVPEPKARRAPAQALAPGVLTVAVAIDRYVEDMTKRGCSPRSVKFTGARLRTHLASWLAMPLTSIGKAHCQAEHTRLTAACGAVQANRVLRDFRALWNLAAKQTDALDKAPRCPVASVTMNTEAGRRDDAIVPDLRGWWARVEDLGNPLRAVMFKLGLLSGLRPGNLCGISPGVDRGPPRSRSGADRFPGIGHERQGRQAAAVHASAVAADGRARPRGAGVWTQGRERAGGAVRVAVPDVLA